MKHTLYILLIRIFRLLPLRRKSILFMSYYGSQYGCNPKYLSEFITRNHPSWSVVWVFNNPQRYHIQGVTKVRYLSWQYFYQLCTCKVIITNYRMTDLFIKRKNQVYIQTWHSSLRLKMIEKDTEASLPPHYVKMAQNDSRQLDYLLSGCAYSTSIFKRCFWFNGAILPTGTPRNDLLFQENDVLKANIKQRISSQQISSHHKVALYAPTFRKGNSLLYYNIEYHRLIQSLKNMQDADWVILVRLHPHLRNLSQSLLNGNKYAIDVTDYDDIQELLYISDVVISDYSSLIFDYAITKRPCFLYVPDLESYISGDRALYFDIKELPFPISKTNTELCTQIEKFDLEQYKDNVTSFLDSIGSYESGNACKNVYNLISTL